MRCFREMRIAIHVLKPCITILFLLLIIKRVNLGNLNAFNLLTLIIEMVLTHLGSCINLSQTPPVFTILNLLYMLGFSSKKRSKKREGRFFFILITAVLPLK